MFKSSYTAWCSPVEAFPLHIGKRCSLPGLKNFSSKRHLLRICSILVAVMLEVIAAQEMQGTGSAAVAELVSTMDEVKGSAGVFRQGERTDISAHHVEERRLRHVTDECTDSPLWGKEVDPSNYMFGCKEIEDMLHGSKTYVGSGKIRDVYVAEYREIMVVLKILREPNDPNKREMLSKLHKTEALVLDAVRGHPNVVGMLGTCNTTVASEYYSNSLDRVIWSNSYSIEKVVGMALGAAKGLQAVHEASIAPIVHYDLKPQQLLIDDGGRVMLNDFNMAKLMATRNNSGSSCSFGAGIGCRVVAWRAPENIAGKPLTEKIDIYSMGMIFFSLISGKLPFPRTESGNRMILRGERPSIDPSWHPEFMEVVRGMWQQEPTDRPSARQVVARLEGILGSLPSF